MKKILTVVFLLSLTWTSCIKEKTQAPLTQQQIKKQVDSIMTIRSKSIDDRSKRDLQLRLKIEVKGIADSMVNMHARPVAADTGRKPPKL